MPNMDPGLYEKERPAPGHPWLVPGLPLGCLSTAARPSVQGRALAWVVAVAFKRAGQDWIGYDLAQSKSTGAAWTTFAEGSTPRELALFGFPEPGHPIWNDALLGRHRAALIPISTSRPGRLP